MADLKLKILMEAVDRVTAPIRAIRSGAAGLRTDVAATAEKLRGLERSAQQLEKFRALKTAAKRNADALAATQGKATSLAAALGKAETTTKAARSAFAAATAEAAKLAAATNQDATALAAAQAKVKTTTTALKEAEKAAKGLSREFAATTAAAGKLKDAGQRGAAELQRLRTQLRSAGVDTGKMASEQKRLKAEIAATTTAADRQAAALAKLAARAKAMAAAKGKMEKTQTVAGTMAGAGAAGLATGGSALAAVASTAMVGIDFEAMMSKVGALAKIEKTSAAFEKLEKQAFDLGATTSFSASQGAEAMANLAMAGFDAEKIYGVMPGMLNLAKAGTTDLGLTASITANIMAGFGLQASQMGDVGDVLVATFTNSNTNLEMLGETMKYVAPIAKAAGYSLGDVAVMAGLLGNVGIQGSDAGTALRASLIRLAAPPKEAKEKLEELGVATKDVAGNMRPFSNVLADIAEKTKAMGNAQKIEMFSKIFGVEAAAAMTELVDKAGSTGIKEMTQTIKAAHGLNDKIAAQMADNAKGDLDNLSSAIEGVAIIITKINTQPLRDLATWAANVATAAGEWMQQNPRLTATLTQVAVAVAALVAVGGGLALTIAGILGPFAILRFALAAIGIQLPALIGGLMGLGRAVLLGVVPALWSMAAALLANPIVWIVAAIAAAATVLIVGWEPVAGFFADLWSRLSGIFGSAWEAIKGTLGFDPLAVLAPYWQPITAFLSGLWENLPTTVAAAWEAIKTVLAFTPLGLIVANWTPIADFLSSLWDGIAAKFADVWAGIQDKIASIRGVVEWAGGAWDSVFGSDKKPPAIPPAPALPTTRALPATASVVTPLPISTIPGPTAPPTPAANTNAPTSITQTITITVHAAPGQSAEDIAREVRRQLEQQAARQRSAARSALHD